MYQDHFGLDTAPFRLTPDPDFLYVGRQYEEGLAHLLYALERGSGGFACITGEVGTGKTTLCRSVMAQLPEHVTCALILNSLLSGEQLLAAIATELGLSPEGDRRALHQRLNDYLLAAYAQGRTVVVIIDEAQNLAHEALEQLRLLTNLETGHDKLLQIILLGQPELQAKLDDPALRQLKQRVTVRFHLLPLNHAEAFDYLEHRLACAGAKRTLFSPSARRALIRAAAGIPRRLNVLADRALLSAFVHGRIRVERTDVKSARAELGEGRTRFATPRSAAIGIAVVLLIGIPLALVGVGLTPNAMTPAVSLPALSEQPVRSAPASVAPPPGPSPMSSEPLFERLVTGWASDEATPVLPNVSTCSDWAIDGLRCVEGRLSLDALLALDRPVIVEWGDGLHWLQQRHGVALLGRSPAYALDPADRLETMRFWSLVQVPTSIPEVLESGDSGPAVAWLGSVLDQAIGLGDLARLRDRIDNGMLEDLNSLRNALELEPTRQVKRIDLWIITALAKVPEQPSLAAGQDLQ